MDFETEKLLAKIAGENIENLATNFVSDSDKSQIDFAFNQMFSGLSLIEWTHNVALSDAWKISLDKMRDYVFSFTETGYIIDFLHNAVFDYRKNTLKKLEFSIHANEYCPNDIKNREDLLSDAREKIKSGMDIIKKFAEQSGTQNAIRQTQKQNIKTINNANEHSRDHEYERIKK